MCAFLWAPKCLSLCRGRLRETGAMWRRTFTTPKTLGGKYTVLQVFAEQLATLVPQQGELGTTLSIEHGPWPMPTPTMLRAMQAPQEGLRWFFRTVPHPTHPTHEQHEQWVSTWYPWTLAVPTIFCAGSRCARFDQEDGDASENCSQQSSPRAASGQALRSFKKTPTL